MSFLLPGLPCRSLRPMLIGQLRHRTRHMLHRPYFQQPRRGETRHAVSSRRRCMRISAVFEKFTERAITGVLIARQQAHRLGVEEVGPEHILLGLAVHATDDHSSPAQVLNVEAVQREVARLCAEQRGSPVDVREIPFSSAAKAVMEQAQMESRRMGMNTITPEHMLIALLARGTVSRRVIVSIGMDPIALKEAALKKLEGDQESEGASSSGGSSAKSAAAAAKAVADFTIDLCERAMLNKSDPVFGRAQEVQRVIQVLGRRSKCNPMLLGEPGVGKTAIAEGLAHAIVQQRCPDGSELPAFLVGKRLMQLDVALLIAGARERGELESRVRSLLRGVDAEGDIILMIDELHMLVGAGATRSGSGLDVSSLLKPALARRGLQCIGATTLDEHRKYIEKDPALERRFQPIVVGEPSQEEALIILEGLKERYERHHCCIYAPAALRAAVALSARYIADRQLPDKAIDLMDEAASRVQMQSYATRRAAALDGACIGSRGLWESLVQVLDAKDVSVKEELFEEAEVLRGTELDMRASMGGPATTRQTGVPSVGEADVRAVVSMWTQIPVERLTQDDASRLLGLESALQRKVVGQDSAVSAVARALRRARAGLRDPGRPIASLLFCGPTGVGKTELTKVLSEHYFGSSTALLRLDMSEYMERHAVNKLIGAPPGYIGYGDGGKLTEAVRRQPHCVLLLDEIEKAHPDVFNLLLQVMEDGRLTDSQGRVVSFKSTLLIMTSNVGSRALATGGARRVGFMLPGPGDAAEARYETVKGQVLDELKAYFRPELLNRLDETVVFRPLPRPAIATIAQLALQQTADRLAARDVRLDISPAVMARLVEEGFDEAYGARPLRRAVTRLVEDPLSEALLHGLLLPSDTAYLDCVPGGEVYVSTQPPQPAVTSSIVEAGSLFTRQSQDVSVSA